MQLTSLCAPSGSQIFDILQYKHSSVRVTAEITSHVGIDEIFINVCVTYHHETLSEPIILNRFLRDALCIHSYTNLSFNGQNTHINHPFILKTNHKKDSVSSHVFKEWSWD